VGVSKSIHPSPPLTSSFKGIALFTPGGDCVYCLDNQKRSHWHVDLCAALQHRLSLAEPPYFLLPGFTATVDRWYDETSQQMITSAEVYPRVFRFQALLNVLFGLGHQQWEINYTLHEACSTLLIDSFREQFPQLWEGHDLVLRVTESLAEQMLKPGKPNLPRQFPSRPYQFRLFVRGSETATTEQMLKLLHGILETELQSPYTLQVVDVTQNPEQAEADHISATPSLIQVSPQPVRRIVGSLTNPDLIRRLLANQSSPLDLSSRQPWGN
jgi:circadian clock protein KaiB